jgi:hypothetical protein
VVTLLLACVFMAGSVRSFSTTDVVYFSFVGRLVSLEGRIEWTSFDVKSENAVLWVPHRGRDRRFPEIESFLLRTRYPGKGTQVRYWCIVTPLNLLSAYLLLSKPGPPERMENLMNKMRDGCLLMCLIAVLAMISPASVRGDEPAIAKELVRRANELSIEQHRSTKRPAELPKGLE